MGPEWSCTSATATQLETMMLIFITVAIKSYNFRQERDMSFTEKLTSNVYASFSFETRYAALIKLHIIFCHTRRQLMVNGKDLTYG